MKMGIRYPIALWVRTLHCGYERKRWVWGLPIL